MQKFHVLIPAAGAGSRMQVSMPKQYLHLLGQPIIQHTLRVFEQHQKINSVHLLLSPEDAYWNALALPLGDKTQVHRCGGATRAETVLNGLSQIEKQADKNDWVLVHDAARPGLNANLLNTLINALSQDSVGGLLAIPVADTLKLADAACQVSSTQKRDALWRAQTPQMFRYQLLKQALESFGDNATDESQAIENLGLKPRLIQGALRNIKITYPEDLQVVEAILKNEQEAT